MASEVPKNTRWASVQALLQNIDFMNHHVCSRSIPNETLLAAGLLFKAWWGFVQVVNECKWKIGGMDKKCKKLKWLGCAVLILKNLPPSPTLPQWFMNERYIARVSGNPQLIYSLFSQLIFHSDNFLEVNTSGLGTLV